MAEAESAGRAAAARPEGEARQAWQAKEGWKGEEKDSTRTPNWTRRETRSRTRLEAIRQRELIRNILAWAASSSAAPSAKRLHSEDGGSDCSAA
jgi:hypothetical protein